MYVSSIAATTAATTAITPIEGASESAATTPTPGQSGGVSFGDLFAKTVEEANQADHTAATKVDALARGASDDLHGTMIAVKEADISIKLIGTMRNKLLDAFQELWKTSV
jgi:flagellar hook-basal body complex protein FliE